MPQPIPLSISGTSFRRLLSRVALPVLAIACAGPALAQTVEGTGGNKVMMFERPPTVDELREAVKPSVAPGDAQDQPQDQPKIRTRSIEIVGGGISNAQRPRPTEPANYGAAPTMAQPAPTMTQPSMPQAAPVMAQPEPAPRPHPKRPHVQEAAAPPSAPLPSGPRPAPRQPTVQPATLSTPQGDAATQNQQAGQQTNGFGFRINFPFNSADIPKEFYAYIDAVGGLMSQDPQLRLVIEGHTDAIGGDQYNLALSERRAVSVGEYLVRVHHVEPQRLAIAGMGKTQPLTPDPTDSRNRRVEFRPVQ
ncbi:OmpA family protein [Azospirillum sp. sgz302134]